MEQVIHRKESKQNLNRKIITESELISVSEYVTYKIHMINIFLWKGYDLYKTVLYQDNEISIRMENNIRNSCTGKLRHISMWYFFYKDCVNTEEFSIEYCNTLVMLAEYFTKPLQESLFCHLR